YQLPLHPPSPTLFPYTTLFRSARAVTGAWGALPATEAGSTRSAYSHGRRLFRKCDAKIDGQRPAAPLPDHDRVASSGVRKAASRSEEHTSELQSLAYLVCRLLL